MWCVSDPVGLSIGTTNLVAARVGAQPVLRRCVLTVYSHRPPEVGLPSQNPNLNESGLVLRGFVDRVGDPVPLVAADGSAHPADRLLVDALSAMVDTVGKPSEVTIAVPAYWAPSTVRALSNALARDRRLTPAGTTPRLVSDAEAAMVALQTQPGLTSDGTVVLFDLGGSGTSITLMDAAGGFRQIADTVRHPDFSGDQIDQAMLSAVLQQLTGSGAADAAATAAVGSLARLRDACRQAKERLSAQTVTTLTVALPTAATDVRFTRTELESLIDAPLGGVAAAAEDLLQRNGRTWSDVSAVLTVGGGASIPFVTQRLSEVSRARLVTTPRPELDVALGAALMAARGPVADASTAISASTADTPTTTLTGIRAGASPDLLAWSQDAHPAAVEPMLEAEPNPYVMEPTGSRPHVDYLPATGPVNTPARRPGRLMAIAVGVAAVIACIAAGGLIYSLTSSSSSPTSTPTSTTTPAPPPPPPPPPVETTPEPPPVIEEPSWEPEPTYEPTYEAPPPETVTETPTTTPPPPTTTAPPETTTTTAVPTTTPPTTTTAAPETATTPPATSSPAATTTAPATAPAMTTTYLTVPFLPVPIPIPIPAPTLPAPAP